MIAGMLAAYVSTLSTHLNWGTSYLVHDFYRRFLRKSRDEKHYVLMGRIITAVLMVLAALLTTVLNTAKEAFDLMLSVGAGTGLIYLLRWFWWRVNAWSEVAAMVSSFLVAVAFFVGGKLGHPVDTSLSLVVTVAATTVVWVVVTFVTAPTERARLVAFYQLVRPAGPGWRSVRAEAGLPPSPDSLPLAMLGWVLGVMFVYSALFGAGSYLYGRTAQGTVWLVLFLISGFGLVRLLPRFWARGPASADGEDSA
jgi:hypothetical protein